MCVFSIRTFPGEQEFFEKLPLSVSPLEELGSKLCNKVPPKLPRDFTTNGPTTKCRLCCPLLHRRKFYLCTNDINDQCGFGWTNLLNLPRTLIFGWRCKSNCARITFPLGKFLYVPGNWKFLQLLVEKHRHTEIQERITVAVYQRVSCLCQDRVCGCFQFSYILVYCTVSPMQYLWLEELDTPW